MGVGRRYVEEEATRLRPLTAVRLKVETGYSDRRDHRVENNVDRLLFSPDDFY